MTELEDRRFDRVESRNTLRLAKYALPSVGITGERFRSYSWRHFQLDQGNQGACTGFAETMEAAARPKPFFGDPLWKYPLLALERPQIQQVAFAVYNWARDNDEYAETHSGPGGEEGSSVDAAARAGLKWGFASSFYWATGTPERKAAQAMEAVAFGGPVKVGSWWRAGMWRASEHGFLRYSGSYEGGHAYLLSRASRERDALWTPNSWGGAGQGWISRTDLVRIAAEGGEFCIAMGRKNRGEK